MVRNTKKQLFPNKHIQLIIELIDRLHIFIFITGIQIYGPIIIIILIDTNQVVSTH